MDKKIEKKQGKWKPVLLLVTAGVVAGVIFLQWQRLNLPSVKKDALQIGKVAQANFDDTVNIRGNVLPVRSMVLSVSEGGRLEKVLIEDGDQVKAGQVLFALSNSNLQLDVSARQTDAATQINNLRANRISAVQRSLSMQRDLADFVARTSEAQSQLERGKSLYKQGFISEAQLENLERNFRQLQEQTRLLREAVKADKLQTREQEDELGSTISILRKNIGMGQQLIERLQVRAPISGRISALQAEVGTTLKQGDVVASIDDESRLKIQAGIDEFYVPNLRRDMAAVLRYNDADYALKIVKIYPNIKDGKAKIDLEFADKQPPEIKIGQSFGLRLQMGESRKSLVLSKGQFLNQSGGNFAYVLNADGDTLEKRAIRTGRKNEQQVEILEGLKAGDQVVISGYEGFAQAEKVRLVQ